MTWTFSVTTNDGNDKTIFVKTTREAIDNREFIGGFQRFLQVAYDDQPLDVVDGQKVMVLKEFDEWLKINVY